MIRNYFKITWRSLWKDKKLTALNLIGLSIAFYSGILLCIYGIHELSYKQFYKNNYDRIFYCCPN
ncbi:hypothetical protein FVB9532_02899 [Mesonia oceanica]|uniref:Uncharacterized protein n=1 Tax=Mesonia oceanica TaxID=2687242 RepID=A0AC61YAU2_9FLAO|nr:hypothetical protein FVB9532_02899 [Mesonia oceanica]